jgi:hypothetical protein
MHHCTESSAHWTEGKELRPGLRQQSEKDSLGFKEAPWLFNYLEEQLERKAGEGECDKSHPIASSELLFSMEPPSPAPLRDMGASGSLSCSCVGAERGTVSQDVLGLCQTLLWAMEAHTGNEWLNPGMGEGKTALIILLLLSSFPKKWRVSGSLPESAPPLWWSLLATGSGRGG